MHQRRLLDMLFENYDSSERPVTNEDDKVTVDVGLSIQQIVDIVSIPHIESVKYNALAIGSKLYY